LNPNDAHDLEILQYCWIENYASHIGHKVYTDERDRAINFLKNCVAAKEKP
jgi:hypothetical protein